MEVFVTHSCYAARKVCYKSLSCLFATLQAFRLWLSTYVYLKHETFDYWNLMFPLLKCGQRLMYVSCTSKEGQKGVNFFFLSLFSICQLHLCNEWCKISWHLCVWILDSHCYVFICRLWNTFKNIFYFHNCLCSKIYSEENFILIDEELLRFNDC